MILLTAAPWVGKLVDRSSSNNYSDISIQLVILEIYTGCVDNYAELETCVCF